MLIYGISLFNVLRAFLNYHCNQSRWSLSGCNFSLVRGMTTGLALFNSPINLLQPGVNNSIFIFCGKGTFSQSLSQLLALYQHWKQAVRASTDQTRKSIFSL